MRPPYHLLASTAGIPVYMLTGSIRFAACFCIAEIFMDIDHIIDYIIFSKRPLRVATFLQKENPSTWSHIVFFLHSYEWIFLLIALSVWLKNSILFAVAAGFALHLLLDEIGNRLPSVRTRISIFFYFFTYRFINGFKVKKISNERG